jgi:hypothetical protein
MDVVPFFRENSKEGGLDAVCDQSAVVLHQICTESPRILLVLAITVARTDVMLDLGDNEG